MPQGNEWRRRQMLLQEKKTSQERREGKFAFLCKHEIVVLEMTVTHTPTKGWKLWNLIKC